MAAGVLAVVAGLLGGADWARARTARTDRVADSAAALDATRAVLPAIADAVRAALQERLDRLAHRLSPDATTPAVFDALEAVCPPTGGVAAWEAGASGGAIAWAGRPFGRPRAVLAALAAGRTDVTVAPLADELRVWVVAGVHIRHWHVLIAAPLGPLDPWIGRVVGGGPIAAAGAAAGVDVWLREPPPEFAVSAVPVPLPLGPDAAATAFVVVPAAAQRAAFWTERAVRRAGLPLGLAVLCATLLVAQLLQRRPEGARWRRGVGVALPLVARGALAALGLPPRLPGVQWLDPATYSATALPWGGGALALGPLAAWFATPLDLLLTGLAVLAAAAVLALSRPGAPGAPAPGPGAAPRWPSVALLIGGAVGARVLVEALAAVVASVRTGLGVGLLPDDRFGVAPGEGLVLAGLAALGLAVGLWLGWCGDRTWRAASALTPAGPARAVALVVGAIAFAVPLGGAVWWWRALAFGAAVVATRVHRWPREPEISGISPMLLRLCCLAALVHVGLEQALDTARTSVTQAAVAAPAPTDAWCRLALARAQALAEDPTILARCRDARGVIPGLGPEARAALPDEQAIEAARAWARHCDVAPLQFGALDVAVDVPGFDDIHLVPFMAFGVNAPRAVRELLGARPPRTRLAEPATVELTHGSGGLRIATARAPIGPPGARLGLVTLTVPDPWEPEIDTVDRWIAVQTPVGLAGRPVRVRYQEGVARAATDARLQLVPMPPEAGRAVALRVPLAYTQRIGDTPYRFWAAHDADGGAIRAAGLPALEPGPVLLRFARFLTVALAIGALGWFLTRRARWWLGLPAAPRWQRRFKHLLVAAFLVLTVPPFVLMAVFSQGLLRATLPTGPEAHHRETLAVVYAQILERVRQLDAAANPEGFALTSAKLERYFSDRWLAGQAEVLGHELHLFDAAGGLLYTSRRDLARAGVRDARLPGSVARELLAADRSAVLEPVQVGGLAYRVGYRVFRSAAGTPVGVLAIPMLAGERALQARLGQTITLIYAMSLLAVLAVASIALLLSRRLARPMETLTDATGRVAAGDLSVRVPVTRGDELGDLQRAFNHMADDLVAGRAALVRAEKEAAWREMAQQIAHEVKNPLTPLKLSAQHLQRAYRDGAPGFGDILTDATQRIIDQVEALRKVASRFSAFAGRPSGAATEVDVNALAAEAVNLYRTGEAPHTFVTEWASPTPRVLADRDDLRRVLINLITNALQAMAGGGELVVRTVRNSRPAPPGRGNTRRIVAARAEAPHGWVGVEVRDTGPGIAPELQERLFEPYFSTKTGGTGLGLWICRSTVEEMGGEISLTSVPGIGTAAWVWLPRLPEAEVPPPAGEATGEAPAGPPDAR